MQWVHGRQFPQPEGLRNRMTVAKWLGSEHEFAVSLLDADAPDPVAIAGEAILEAHAQSLGAHAPHGGTCPVNQFDLTGARFYLDHDKIEYATPLCASAVDLVLCARRARAFLLEWKATAQQSLGPILISANNSSRSGTRWAAHYNFMLARAVYDRWAAQDFRPLRAQWVPFLATLIPISGSGKLGAENGAPAAAFQISQRSDFIAPELCALDTVLTMTFVNLRDEPLADPARFARKHVTCLDTLQNEFASWLTAGAMQLLLAALEEGEFRLPDLTLADPVEAVRTVSRDLSFSRLLALEDGRRLTALDIQETLATCLGRAILDGSVAGRIPHAGEIVDHWFATLCHLRQRNPILPRRLDWATRLRYIQSTARSSGNDPRAIELADLRFGDIGGVFDSLQARGLVDRLEDFLSTAPQAPTLVPRDEARVLLLEKLGLRVVAVDWHFVLAKVPPHEDLWIFDLLDPFDSRPAEVVRQSGVDLAALADRLHALHLARPAETDRTRGDSHVTATQLEPM